MNDLLTVNEVAAILRLSPFTIRRWIKEQKLRAVKVGSVWRVYKVDLEKFLGEVPS